MKIILLMTDGIYRAVIGTSLVPINSTTRGTAHISNLNKIPTLTVNKVYFIKENKFDLIPYPMSKWGTNIETIVTKYYDNISDTYALEQLGEYYENQKLNSPNWTTTNLSTALLQASYWTQYRF